MKKFQRSLLAVALASTINIAADNSAATYYSTRSQGVNSVRELVGWQEFVNLCEADESYTAMAVVPEFSQTFRSRRICECLFGDSVIESSSDCDTDCPTSCDDCKINITGSCVSNRGDKDWLADYFGLPTDYNSSITFRPRVQNFVADVQFYFGLDDMAEGAYFRLNLPINWTRWDLRFCENLTEKGTNNHAPGYFSGEENGFEDTNGISRNKLYNNAIEYFTGQPINLGEVTFRSLECSKWACKSDCNDPRTITRLADFDMVLGWNAWCNDNYHFGFNVRLTAPTGNAPTGEFLFEPISGNGGHWELGGGISTHYDFWTNEETNATFGFYLDANITHLFAKCQTRCFDLCGKVNSRYMLAQKMIGGSQVTDLLGTVAGTKSDVQFDNEYAPVANITKSNVDVKSTVQGDLALKFTYNNGDGFSWDIGYNFWARSCEKIKRKTPCNDPLDGRTWALKGDAFVYGFDFGTEPEQGDDELSTQALGATQSEADIHSGTNWTEVTNSNDCATATAAAALNPNIDTRTDARNAEDNNNWTSFAGGTTGTSTTPVMLKVEDLNIVRTRGISHKIFTHFSYAWLERDYSPFLGFGASAEFSPKRSCKDACDTDCDTSCDTSCDPCDTPKGQCLRCAFNQWSVWIKGGFSFHTS